MDIFDQWLAGKKRLTPAEVKAKEIGSCVWLHQCYGKRGEHLFVRATVAQSCKKKQLAYRDHDGNMIFKDIKSSPKIAYTED